MWFKVLLYLWFLGLIKTGFPAEIFVSLGSSTVLNCSIVLNPTVDNSLLNVSWFFSSSVIATKNQTLPGYFLDTSASSIGHFPLTVYNITPHQQGVYECLISYNETEYITDVTLTILVPPLVSIRTPDLHVLKGKSVVECWAKNFSPPQIMFTWTKGGKKLREPQKLQVNHSEDGLYDAVSWLTFIPEISVRNTSFGCKVQHKALVKPITERFMPHVIALPKVTVSAVSSSSHSSPLTLFCDISGFYPENASVVWMQNGKALPERPMSVQEDGTYRTHGYHTLSVEERSRGGEVECVVQQPHVHQPAYGAIDLSTTDSRAHSLGLNKSAKASVAMMIISLTLVFLLCFGFSWKKRDEKLKTLNVSAIVLPPRVTVGKKGRVTITVEGRLAERVQTTWFLNDVPISDTSYKDKKYTASYTPRNSAMSVVSEKSPLLPSIATGYYKLHTQPPPRSTSSPNKQLFSSVTFIPNLPIHKGAVFKCQVSYKGKDKIVAERVSDKFTIQAPPEVSEIQFSEPNEEGGVIMLTALASHFHPDVITFRWFCEGGELSPVSLPQAQAAPKPDAEGFFSAMSQCRLPKEELERGETKVWVSVHHMALKQPITRETRGFIKTPSVSEIFSSPHPSTVECPLTLACDITGFYPPDISVKWLRLRQNEIEENGGEIQHGAEVWGPLQTLQRTFRAKAILKNVDVNQRESGIICRVTHCSLLKPVEKIWKNAHIEAPTIPSSLTVQWSSDGVGMFSLLLCGGNPKPELFWAAGGKTISKLLSRDKERINSEGKLEVRSVCALVKSRGRQQSDSHRRGHAYKIKQSTVDNDGDPSNRPKSKEYKEEEQDEDLVFDPSLVNTVTLRKEKTECLKVTVEITHPALSLPAYITWTEPTEEVS